MRQPWLHHISAPFSPVPHTVRNCTTGCHQAPPIRPPPVNGCFLGLCRSCAPLSWQCVSLEHAHPHVHLTHDHAFSVARHPHGLLAWPDLGAPPL